MKELAINSFDVEVLQSDKIVVIDFFATWCAPCREITPILEVMEKEFGDKVVIYKVNADDNYDLVSKYKVEALPTVVFFKDGVEVKRFKGVKSERDIRLLIEEMVQISEGD